MKITIINTDKDKILLLTGVPSKVEGSTLVITKTDKDLKMLRYVLRPGEKNTFTLQDDWFLGLEEL